jgi:hypothetical protein
MSNISRRGCRKHARMDPMRIYDSLPAEVRRGLQLAPVDFCPGCIAADMRKHGAGWVVGQLAEARCHERRDGLWLPCEPLRP